MPNRFIRGSREAEDEAGDLIRSVMFAAGDGMYGLHLFDTGTEDRYNKTVLRYRFVRATRDEPDAEILFEGSDFATPHSPESDETIRDLMGFLTLRPGDTDEDYFKDYTDRQMEWCESEEAEEVRMEVERLYGEPEIEEADEEADEEDED